MQRIGILGGAFNPPHFGHLRPALEAQEILGLDQVMLIPSGDHPFKPDDVLAPAQDRLAMTRLAVGDEPHFHVSGMEILRQGTSYTIDTLRHLRGRFPRAQLFFLMGSDLLQELHLWRNWFELINYAHLVVLTRPGFEHLVEEAPAAKALRLLRADSLSTLLDPDYYQHLWFPLPVTPLGISSTDMRQRVRQGKSLRYLTPKSVVDYIFNHRLYREPIARPAPPPTEPVQTEAPVSAAPEVTGHPATEVQAPPPETTAAPSTTAAAVELVQTTAELASWMVEAMADRIYPATTARVDRLSPPPVSASCKPATP